MEPRTAHSHAREPERERATVYPSWGTEEGPAHRAFMFDALRPLSSQFFESVEFIRPSQHAFARKRCHAKNRGLLGLKPLLLVMTVLMRRETNRPALSAHYLEPLKGCASRAEWFLLFVRVQWCLRYPCRRQRMLICGPCQLALSIFLKDQCRSNRCVANH